MHRPGEWAVMAETSNGRTYLGASEDHCRQVFAAKKLVPRTGRVEVVGAVLLDPAGSAVDSWGVDVPLDSTPPLFESLRHLVEGEWRDCRTCGRLISMGQLVSTSGKCSMCTYNADTMERPCRFDEAEETIPHQGDCAVCVRLRSRLKRASNGQVKKGKHYVPEVGDWLCDDHTLETKQRIARERYSRAEGETK